MEFLYTGLILILFFLLGKAADILISNVKLISEKLNIKISIIGIILGILTTSPEFFLGINAIKNNIQTVALGNLLGGTVILFSFLFGLNLILNKKIETDGHIKNILPNFLIILLPIISGLKGSFTFYDAIFFLILYFVIIFYIEKNNININEYKIRNQVKLLQRIKNKFLIFSDKNFIKEIFLSSIGLILLILISNLIIRFSNEVLETLKISNFFIGLIMFSIGTNLPELMIILKAKNKNSDLSLSHLVGSAMANIFVLCVLTLINPFKFTVSKSYILTLCFVFILLLFITIFYKTNKSFSRREGLFLTFIYLIFLGIQVVFLLN